MAGVMTNQFALSQPKLSIMIPTYGDSPFLRETLDSLIQNTRADITNIFVVDDASPTSHVKELCSTYLHRIKYVRNEENLGLAGNFQNCIDRSNTEYTLIMGSDDRVLEGFEKSFLSSIEQWPDTAVLQLAVFVIDENGKQLRGLTEKIKSLISPVGNKDISIAGLNLVNRILIGQFLYFPAIIWRTEILTKYPLDLKYKTAVDLDLILRLALENEIFSFSSIPTFEYRRHSASISSQLGQSTVRIDEEFLVHEKFIHNSEVQGFSRFNLLARLALTVRLHSLKTGAVMLAKGSKNGRQLISRALKPIRIRR